MSPNWVSVKNSMFTSPVPGLLRFTALTYFCEFSRVPVKRM